MSEWWTYRLSDFLMFSPEIYWRLVERYNREAWPLQLLGLAAGAVLMWLARVRRPGTQRMLVALLAAAWLWTGWAFHWQRYAPINWAAQYLALAFAAQAALLLAAAIFHRPGEIEAVHPRVRSAGLVVAALGVLIYPLASLLAGRPLAQAEVFGLMPEPTALATLGLLAAAGIGWRRWLSVIPALSLAVGLLTLWMMAR